MLYSVILQVECTKFYYFHSFSFFLLWSYKWFCVLVISYFILFGYNKYNNIIIIILLIKITTKCLRFTFLNSEITIVIFILFFGLSTTTIILIIK